MKIVYSNKQTHTHIHTEKNCVDLLKRKKIGIWIRGLILKQQNQ